MEMIIFGGYSFYWQKKIELELELDIDIDIEIEIEIDIDIELDIDIANPKMSPQGRQENRSRIQLFFYQDDTN